MSIGVKFFSEACRIFCGGFREAFGRAHEVAQAGAMDVVASVIATVAVVAMAPAPRPMEKSESVNSRCNRRMAAAGSGSAIPSGTGGGGPTGGRATARSEARPGARGVVGLAKPPESHQ